MKFNKRDLLLYAVTDRAWLNGRSLSSQVEEALTGGATFVQLREKNLSREEFLREAREIQALCRRYGVPFVVNDDVEIARETGAGVHVGQDDRRAGEARALLGPEAIIGVSVKTVEQALQAEREGADYLGVGAVFPTGSKADATLISHETLRDICRAVRIPAVAIGGINRDNAASLAGSGICGIAVISAIFAAQDARAAAAELRALAEKAFS